MIVDVELQLYIPVSFPFSEADHALPAETCTNISVHLPGNMYTSIEVRMYSPGKNEVRLLHVYAEIWDQATKQWTLLDATHKKARTYHSIAILMPDGRVLTGGGGLCGRCSVNHPDVEIFNPPYLYKKNGDLADRPTVKVNRATAENGSWMTVTSSEEMMMVSMIRFGSVTHATNTDQRRIELCGPYTKACAGKEAVLQVPSDAGVAVPGNWMIFAVNKNGVPSEAAVLNVKL
jgi:galactose oxidase